MSQENDQITSRDMLPRRFIPAIVSITMFMETVDSTIINTAIPSMAESFHVIPVDLKVALIGYLVSLAVFIPISGWVADKFGIKKVFISALFIFTVSSLLCGFSRHLAELVIFRICQGVGGSFMMPLGRLMIIQWFGKQEFLQTMNRVVMPALVGPALGPLLGGIITQLFSWHWIFWVNVPLGIICIICAKYLLPEKNNVPRHALDKVGFMLFGMGLAGFTFGLSALSESVFSYQELGLILGSSILLLIFYIQHSIKQPYPVLESKLFLFRTFRLAILGNLVARLGIGAVLFLLPLMLQIKLHYPPSLAGLFVAATAIGMLCAKTFSKKIVFYFRFKKVLLINTFLLGLSLILFGTITANTTYVQIILQSIIFGFLMSLQFSGMNPLVFSEIEPELFSAATSIHSTTMQLSQSFGVAICAFIFKKVTGSFEETFMGMGIITLLSNVVFLYLKKGDGDNLIKF